MVRKGDHTQPLVITLLPYMYMYMYVSTVHVHPYMGSANFTTYFLLKRIQHISDTCNYNNSL